MNLEEIEEIVAADGAQLHRRVPPNRWCVTHTDLKVLRHVVGEYIAKGKILPTMHDDFDAADDAVGPSIHTVNAQLIKPVTERAGGMSWALMLHPDGLECDVFVTHCWQEGIYEFIDKVLHSWPHFARHAYCCMLSNPQNLDIGELISSPSSSPFAQALHNSTYMLAVPNHHCSIYSRIWCVYEAFLAYSESKVIFVASSPVQGLERQVSHVVMTSVAASAAVWVAAAQFDIDTFGEYVHIEAEVSLAITLACVVITLVQILTAVAPPSPAARVLAHSSAVCCGVCLGFRGRAAVVMCARHGLFGNFTSAYLPAALAGLGFCIGTAAMEADRLWRQRAQTEASQLLAGYTGSLRDATSSKAEDREKILEELAASGMEDAVDSAIHVLLDSGVSTPALRTAVLRAGTLEQAGYWHLSAVVNVWTCMTLVSFWYIPFHAESYWYSVDHGYCRAERAGGLCADHEEGPAACTCIPPHESPEVLTSLVGALLALAWLFLFSLLQRGKKDERGFAAAALTRIAGLGGILAFCLPEVLLGIPFVENHVGRAVLAYVIAPAVLLISAAGPGRTARVPVIGPLIVRCLMVRRPGGRRLQRKQGLPPAAADA